MKRTALRFDVSKTFARRYRAFCAADGVDPGEFAERALTELMEDHHFGMKGSAGGR